MPKTLLSVMMVTTLARPMPTFGLAASVLVLLVVGLAFATEEDREDDDDDE